MSDLKPQLLTCQQKGKDLRDFCYHGDKPKVEAKLKALSSEWNRLQSASQERKHKLEDALLRLGQFQETLSELLSWISEQDDKLNNGEAPGVMMDKLESRLAELKVQERI